MKYRIQDLIDIEQFQSMQDRLSAIYPFPCAIIDNDGEILTATAWQDICTKFHRQNKECEKECIKSDQYILEHLSEANPAVSYRCPHGLVDNAMPIIVDGQHLANFFTGQFFTEQPDMEFLRKQGARFGFDEDAYIQAAQRVPVWEEKQVDNYLHFIKEMIEVISSSGLRRLKEIEATKALQRSENKYRSLFEQAGDYILILQFSEDKGLVVVDANQAACRLHGYTREEFINIQIKDLDKALNEEQIQALVVRIMSGETVRFETVHSKKDGSIFPVEVSSTRLETGDGPILITSVERDITERKKAETQLEREQLLLTASLNSPLDIIILAIDHEYNYLFFNDAHRSVMLNVYQANVETGMNILDQMSVDEDRELAKQCYDRALGGESHSQVDEYGEATERLYYETFYSPIYDSHNQIIGATAFARDITERRHTDEALQNVNNLLQSGLDSIPLAYIVWDMDLNVTEWNRAAETIFGYKREEAIGRNAVELIVPEKDRGIVSNVMKHLSIGAVMDYSERDNNIRKGGEIISCRWYNMPLITQDGDQFAILTIAEDITTKMQMESAQADLQEKLARSRRMESLGVLAGGVAHDLNNVLGPMVLLPDMISRDLATEEELNVEEVREALGVIKTSANRAARIVTDLVHLGRRGNSSLVPLNINEHHCVAGDCADIDRIRAANPGVSIVHKLTKESLIISADDSHLSRAICNLIQNGAESIEKKGKVTLLTSKKSLSEPLIGYEAVPRGDYAVIEISDTGTGIDAALRARMFEPFVTRKKNTDRSGSGLGLSVVHGIVKDHNGFIDVKSEVGKGSVLTLYLPLTGQPEAPAGISEGVPVVGGTERVLIVDDEPGQRFIGLRSLKRLGYEVAEAEDGHQALEHFAQAKEAGEESPYDLIVLDMVMEDDFDGLKTYQAIQELFPKQKVIICSGHAEDDRAKAAQELGTGWLAKPYEMDDLAMAVRERLDRDV